MPAPKRPNTAKATAQAAKAARRRGQETQARRLREAGWIVIPPEQIIVPAPRRPPAGYTPYGERKPVTVAETLDNLNGPTAGTIVLPHHLDWSGNATYNLDEPGRLASMYRAVLTEARDQDDLTAWLNRAVLIDLWPTMWLPPKVRREWETRHPELGPRRQEP